jgi:hypothetical protein
MNCGDDLDFPVQAALCKDLAAKVFSDSKGHGNVRI